jgi:fatty-acyl-CoA synthase
VTDLLWPRYATPADLKEIESIPLAQRGLPESTYAVLQRAAALWPDRNAVTVMPSADHWQRPSTRTFSQLLTDVHKAANTLHRLGIERHSPVTIISPNCDELITATVAAQLAGIAAPINGGLSGEHISHLVERSGASVLIAASPELDATSWQVAEHLAGDGVIDTILLLRPTGDRAVGAPAPAIEGVTVRYFSDFPEDDDGSSFDGEAPAARDLATLFHTGGTTGKPKPAPHTHANEVANAWMIAANTLLDQDCVLFAGLPLFHVNALVVTLLAPLLRGQQAVWAGPLGYRDVSLYANFWKIVQHYGIGAMSGVPTVYAMLAQLPVDADISSLRYALVGASAMPAAVRKDFESHTGVPLVEGYGLTEATCASVRSFPEHPRIGSAGQRLPYQQIKTVRIDDGHWHDLPCGEVGNLALKGPTVFPGYVTARTSDGYVLDGLGKLNDGWLDTGDLARVDDDGFVYLTGRAKDLIIRGGHNIEPAMIEDALLAHPDVTGAAAVGRPDAHAGEVPVAYATVTPGTTVTEQQLQTWAGARVAERAATPKSVAIIDALPVTAVGKPYKVGLRADAARSAIEDALAGTVGVDGVDATVDDGSIVVTVTVDPSADAEAIAAILGRYTLTWDIKDRS